jgi:hypothetical protein
MAEQETAEPVFVTPSGVELNMQQLLEFTIAMWMRETKLRERTSDSLRAHLEERSWRVDECRVWWEGSRHNTSVKAQLVLQQYTITVMEVAP